MRITKRKRNDGGFEITALAIGLFILIFVAVVWPFPRPKPPLPLATNSPPVLPVEFPNEFDDDPWYEARLSRPPVPSARNPSPIPYDQMPRELLSAAARWAICNNGRESL